MAKSRAELEKELEELIKYKAFLDKEKYIKGLSKIRQELIELLSHNEINAEDYNDVLQKILGSLNISET